MDRKKARDFLRELDILQQRHGVWVYADSFVQLHEREPTHLPMYNPRNYGVDWTKENMWGWGEDLNDNLWGEDPEDDEEIAK